MSYSMKNALADFKKEELADGMIAVLKEQAKSLERKNENGVTSLKLITQGTIDSHPAEVCLDEQHGELVQTSCRCRQFQKQYFSCEHVTAVVMQYIVETQGQDAVKQSEIFPLMLQKTQVEDPFIPGILKSTDVEMMAILKDNFSRKPILPVRDSKTKIPFSLQAKCCIGECKDGLLLELRIGESRMYVIRDLNDFFYKWTEKKTIELGKYIKFMPDESLLDESGRQVLRFFLEEYLGDRIAGGSGYSYYGYSGQQSRSASIYGSRIDTFMKMIAVHGVCLLSNEKETVFYRDEMYSPQIQVTKLAYGANLNVEKYTVLCESFDYSYVLSGDTIYRMKKPEPAVQKVLDLCRSKRELFVSDKDLPAVTRDVLANLQDTAVISYTGMDPAKYLPPKPTLALYLDYPQENMITCDPAAVYSGKRYHIYGKERYNQKRNFTEEHRLAETIQSYFNAFDQEKGLLVYSGDESDIFTFLSQVLPRLRENGEIYVTDAMKKLRIVRSSGFQVGVSVSDGLLEMSMVSNQFNKEELAEIFSSYDRKKKYHRLKNGEFITFNEEQEQVMSVFSDVIKNYADKKNPDTIKMPLFRALYLDEMLAEKESVELKKNREYRRLIGRMRSYENGDYEVPQSLDTILREYQRDGFYWIKTLKENGFGGILADDMGLGKTLQVLTFLLSEKEQGKTGDALRTLIVAPASLVYNWAKEIERFTPQLSVCMVAGTAHERKELIQSQQQVQQTQQTKQPQQTQQDQQNQQMQQTKQSQPTSADVWITSYDLLKRDIELYQDIVFANQIIDEAQYIKNQTTHAAKSVRLVNSSFRMALTGTPMENRLSELWSIFDYLMPGFLYGYTRFRSELETPIVSDKDEDTMARLRAMIHPFILRRLKKDVLKELPEKQEEIVPVALSGEQKKLYQAHAQRLKMFLEDQNDEDFAQNKLQVLAELTKLRQLCCGPELILEKYKGENAKLEACIELVTRAIEGGHKILLFSQFTSMLDRIGEELKRAKIDYYRIDGSVKKEDRMEMVEQFQAPQNQVAVFCISLKAGGTGLNLTAADIVIHYDPWWNKAAQNQATDRAHRIGQKRAINVYQLIAEDTIEQKICELQQAKYDLAEEVLSGDGISSIQFNKDEIMNLLGK